MKMVFDHEHFTDGPSLRVLFTQYFFDPKSAKDSEKERMKHLVISVGDSSTMHLQRNSALLLAKGIQNYFGKRRKKK